MAPPLVPVVPQAAPPMHPAIIHMLPMHLPQPMQPPQFAKCNPRAPKHAQAP